MKTLILLIVGAVITTSCTSHMSRIELEACFEKQVELNERIQELEEQVEELDSQNRFLQQELNNCKSEVFDLELNELFRD